jgi:hypothetical protein
LERIPVREQILVMFAQLTYPCTGLAGSLTNTVSTEPDRQTRGPDRFFIGSKANAIKSVGTNLIYYLVETAL